MRPYIICHMLQSIDGRIDCSMTEQIDDTNHYYEALEELGCDATIEGRFATCPMTKIAPSSIITSPCHNRRQR